VNGVGCHLGTVTNFELAPDDLAVFTRGGPGHMQAHNFHANVSETIGDTKRPHI
jgi:hypothetical protein